MTQSVRPVYIGIVLSVLSLAGCQSPTDPDETLEVDDFLEVLAAPNPTTATESNDGRSYRVVRGNNQPDDILVFDWKTAFTLTATLNSRADDDDTLEFPVSLTAVTVVVKQAIRRHRHAADQWRGRAFRLRDQRQHQCLSRRELGGHDRPRSLVRPAESAA